MTLQLSVTHTLPCRWRRLLRLLFAAREEESEGVSLSPEKRFEALINDYGVLISRICFSFARTGADYDDLRQDTLFNLWRGLECFRGEAALSTWVYRVTLNTCVAGCRHIRSQGKASLTEALQLPDNTYEQAREQREEIDHLHWLISRLPPLDRAIMIMWLDGRPYEEIAEVTGLQRNTVATRLRRSKMRLAEFNSPHSNTYKR